MKNIIGLAALCLLTSVGVHKFYTALYQLHFEPAENRLEITGRIFLDDLNDALSKSTGFRTHLGEKGQTDADLRLFRAYITKHFLVKIDGKQMPLVFVNNQIEADVWVCYFKAENINSVKSIEVKNDVLLDWNDQQQNIIQADVLGNKKGLLLQSGDSSGILNF